MTATAGAVQPGASEGGATLEVLAQHLAAWTSSAEDIEAARVRVADATVAVRFGGTLATWAAAGRGFARLLGGARDGWRSCAGETAVVGWDGAILASRCRLTEIDDIELATCTTPGSVVVSTALAVAGMAGCEGRDFLDAVVLGYEAVVGAAALLGGAFAPSVGTWPTRAVAAVGAAATTVRALGLSPAIQREALALAAGASFVGVSPEPARSWSLGMAVAQGIGAGIAAAEGMRGDARLLARWPGIACASPPDGSVARVRRSLSAGPSAIRRSRLKPYAAARQVLSGSATLRALVEDGTIDPADVVGVVLVVPALHAAMLDRPTVAQRLDTLASAQYQLAVALEAPSRLDELDHPLPPTSALAARMASVRVEANGSADANEAGAFPDGWATRLELRMRDGHTVRHHAPGTPHEEAFEWERVERKARRLAAANGLDAGGLERALTLVHNEDWKDLATLLVADEQPQGTEETGVGGGQ